MSAIHAMALRRARARRASGYIVSQKVRDTLSKRMSDSAKPAQLSFFTFATVSHETTRMSLPFCVSKERPRSWMRLHAGSTLSTDESLSISALMASKSGSYEMSAPAGLGPAIGARYGAILSVTSSRYVGIGRKTVNEPGASKEGT